jgi:hypothetical protein
MEIFEALQRTPGMSKAAMERPLDIVRPALLNCGREQDGQ